MTKTQSNDTEHAIKELTASVNRLDKKIGRLASYKQSFGLFIVRGIAFTIGASLIAGIIIGTGMRFIRSIEDVPVVNRVVDTLIIQEVLRQYELSQQNGGL